MSESLGKARLDLEVDLAKFRRETGQAGTYAEGLEDKLDALAAIANFAERQLNDVRVGAAQAAGSERAADRIEGSLGGVGRVAMEANRRLEQVKIDAAQAAKSEVAGDVIERKLKSITGEANEARRSLESVKIAGGLASSSGVFRASHAVGASPGFLGLVGAGALATPAAAPAAAGLLAGIPALAGAGAGAIGTLMLAFDGLGDAIGGDKEKFDQLNATQQRMVLTIRSMHGWLGRLKQTASQNLLPGLIEGLQAAASAGTVNAITRAVGQFGKAIGQAGVQWGRYFGSGQFQELFGPLMQSGARNLAVLSTAFLRLFDAVGVLGRAGIPLVNWLSDAAARGAQLADSWLRAQDASGGLARGMSEAQVSLRLVGGLLVAAGRAVYQLGAALYPVAKVFVKQLTDGLNALAGIIQRNQGAIREIASAFVTGLVTAVKVAVDGLRLLNAALGHIVGDKAAIVTAILVIGAAITLALGPTSAAVAGVIVAVGLIVKHLDAIREWGRNFDKFMNALFSGLWDAIVAGANIAAGKLLSAFTLVLRKILGIASHLPFGVGDKAKQALDSIEGFIDGFERRGSARMAQAGETWGNAWGDAFGKTATDAYNRAIAKLPGKPNELGPGPGMTPAGPKGDVLVPGYTPPAAGVFGTPPPFDTKGSTKTKKAADSFELPFRLRLAQAQADITKTLTDDLNVARQIRGFIRAAIPKLHGEKLIGAYEALAAATDKLTSAAEAAAQAAKDAAERARRFAVPLRLQVSEAKFDALDRQGNLRDVLKKIRATAQKALRSGRLGLEGQLEAWRTIGEINDRLKDQTAAHDIKANERQFLESFAQILDSFEPNATPRGKTDTHLYDLVHETRQSNRHLRDLAARNSFPDTGYAVTAAGAMAG